MGISSSTAAGPNTGTDSTKAASQSQAMWRFLHNDSVAIQTLIEPLKQAARDGCSSSKSQFVLIMHDWSKLDFKTHKSKRDKVQLTHKNDVGYDLTASLAVDASSGTPIAPIAMQLRTNKRLINTMRKRSKLIAKHLDQIEPVMAEVADMKLERTPVHIIDREADSLGHFRQWAPKGHLMLIRCDDRRVKWNGESVLLSEIKGELDSEHLFQDAGEALKDGKRVKRQVAEVAVVLDRIHKTRVGGIQKDRTGARLAMRAVFVRLLDHENYILAEWMLLTNVAGDLADSSTVGLWYYHRWKIESFFKLIKSAGQQIECWQQSDGMAIMRRLLVGSMACVYVWRLLADDSEEATQKREHLMKLSGRQTKRGVRATASGLLAGWYALLSVMSLLESGTTVEQLRKYAQTHAPPGFVV